MIDYIKRHETYVRELLAGHPEKETLAELLVYHDRPIKSEKNCFRQNKCNKKRPLVHLDKGP